MRNPREAHEWQAWTELPGMLHCLEGEKWHPKLHRFAVLCCRRIWDLIPTGACQDAVLAAERFVEGAATKSDLYEARRAVGHYLSGPYVLPRDVEQAAQAAYATTHPAARATREVSAFVQNVAGLRTPIRQKWKTPEHQRLEASQREEAAQADLLRELVGNPFCPVKVERAWTRFADQAAVRLARSIHMSQNFDHLPLMADVLEEAGCRSPAILKHCRQREPHARGCWVVELLRNQPVRD